RSPATPRQGAAMSEHRMAAIFYVGLGDGTAPASLEELAVGAGLRNLLRDRDPDVLYGQWSVMESVRAQRETLALHVCLQLYPHLSDLLDRRNDGDGAMPIAEAFRDACEALRPDAAL